MTAPTPQEIEALLARVPEGFTPGPWYPVFNGHFWDISLEDRPMAHTIADTCASNEMYGEHMGADGRPGNHAEANARLIAMLPELVTALRALAEERDRRDAIVAETVQMLAELRAKLDAAAEARDAKLASIEAGVTALAEERDRLAARSYELAVAIMGGEDAPGYADSVDTETLVEQLRGDRRRERVESERLAAENARLRAECARQANVLEGGDWSDDLAEPPHA